MDLAPQKVQPFFWQLILGRLPTQGNLSRRGMSLDRACSDCVWCPGIREVEDHLFVDVVLLKKFGILFSS